MDFFFLSTIYVILVHFRQWQKHKWSSQQKGAGKERDKSLPKNKSKRKSKKKRRYMKSSCRWTTIHFHFEVLRTVVKCDCMWQSPSLPVYHDGYTLPPWWCCITHVRACTHIDKYMNAETRRSEFMQARVHRRRSTHMSCTWFSDILTHRYKVISDPLWNCRFS